ncbi:fatty acyl-CoA hydrolase precursor, medium chain-like [Nerophis lumbriciformis]|uniref:fatty acyl-CoA hydrolase precursor, medium chain-like n=1 Tax=Nerophis lumbriciformis TaxID=546530 RepID=UPI002ADF66CC|nr:fatty acyl-CoA hydrolase precursor, medium chain-like [Nerophis lumbriciformis]
MKETFCFLLTLLFACVAAKSDAPIVHTALGSLKGDYVSVKGKETGVYAYLSVPFAKPPLGPALRLSAPQDVDRWEGVRDATKQPPICMQSRQVLQDVSELLGGLITEIPDVSEDCLYLNIYTPESRAHDAKLPVMVWIHGGGFAIGSTSSFDGSALAAYQDVVVVLIQYRLGIWGFSSTGDEHMSGNFGLLDQVQALRWVQKHIHNFGGDPSSVTIFGESAGGVSVSMLLLSPLSHGLIHRAIAQSGTAAMDALVTNDPLPVTKAIANRTGCNIESTQHIADCMKNLDPDTILKITEQEKAMKIYINIDGVFLKKPLNELFEKQEILNVPFMTGVNDHEGGWLLPAYVLPPNWTEGIDREQFVNGFSAYNPNPEESIVTDLLVDEYVGVGEDRAKIRDAFTEMLGDMLFVIPAIKTANAHRDAGVPVYLYEYQHSPHFLRAHRPSFVRSDHRDEVFAVFGFCFTTTHIRLTDACPEEEEQLSKTVMSYWGAFARTGSPNGDGLAHWPNYGGEEHFLGISEKKQVTGQHLKQSRFVFMTQILPEKLRLHLEKLERSEL